MSGIREWLDGLGLEQYAKAFEAGAIGLELLPELDHDVLKDLGVSVPGHRMTILKAARSLGSSDSEEAPKAPTNLLSRKAERRQITVMFCDLVGSTTLSEQLDPEDLRVLMQSYQTVAGKVIERYGGHVAQYLGDGIMTYFGWPQAHEDDAERAVRAGLDIVGAVGQVDAPTPLQVRIGVATGPVVVGETGAGDASVPNLAVGETPNLAARLQGVARADEIVVGLTARRLLGDVFELDDLGEHELKGIQLPVPAWRVRGVAESEGRFEARTRHLARLVGRDPEMAMVMARWERTKAGEGQVIALSGEPGIGKSRIAQTVRERVADEPHTRLRYQCSPYHTNSALYPVIEQIERAAGFAREDDAEAKLDKLEELLQDADDTSRALVTSLMSLPVDRYPPLALSPQRQKEETLRVLAEGAMALASEQPVLLVFEDAHWIDPTSQELLDLMVPMTAAHRVLAVITHRPEYTPPWVGQGHVTVLALQRLGRSEAAAMVTNISDVVFADDILEQIVARTDGVPLFVEELTKAVAEGGDAGVPDTLLDSLMARLDRLGSAKEIAQIGACIGRKFTHELLAVISDIGEADMRKAMTQLMDSELVYRHGSAANPAYSFKHALVQDAAYRSLLRSRRREVHRRIAETLVSAFARSAEAEPEIVAYHFSQARLYQPAIDYWRSAGNAAARRSAHTEAVAHYDNALRDIATLKPGNDRDSLELDVLFEQFSPLLASRGYQADAVLTAQARAIALCEDLREETRIFPFLYGHWLQQYTSGFADDSLRSAEEFVCRAEGQAEIEPRVSGLRMMGVSYWLTGEPKAATDAFTAALAILGTCPVDTLVYGNDLGVLLRSYRARVLSYRGLFDQAIADAEAALARARALGHPLTIATALAVGFWAYADTSRWQRSLELADEVFAFSVERELPYFVESSPLLQACALLRAGRLEECVSKFEEHLGADGEHRAPVTPTIYLADYAMALGQLGDSARAQRLLNKTFGVITAGGERFYEAEAFRIGGQLDRIDRADGESNFQKSREIAISQGNKLMELRATTSLARLWRADGKVREAHNLLAPVYAGFREGFDAPIMMEAKTLLEELK